MVLDLSTDNYLQHTHVGALVMSDNTTHIRSGCAVTASSPEAMTVEVASGVVYVAGTKYSPTSDNEYIISIYSS